MGLDKIWAEALRQKSFTVLVEDNTNLIPKSDINSFLDWINGKGILLGAEGFKHDAGKWVSLPDCIIDYSGGDKKESITFHRRVINNDPAWSEADFVEFILK